MDSVGSRLQKARNDKGYTQKELSEKTGIDRSTIANYERDAYPPDIKKAIVLCNILNITTDFLLHNNVRITNNDKPEPTLSELEELKKSRNRLEETLNMISSTLRDQSLELAQKEKLLEAKSEKIESLYEKLLHLKGGKTGTNG